MKKIILFLAILIPIVVGCENYIEYGYMALLLSIIMCISITIVILAVIINMEDEV